MPSAHADCVYNVAIGVVDERILGMLVLMDIESQSDMWYSFLATIPAHLFSRQRCYILVIAQWHNSLLISTNRCQSFGHST